MKKTKSLMKNLAAVGSTTATASTSRVRRQDSRSISQFRYPPASAVYENYHNYSNNVLSDVDEDDDDDNHIYYNQDEHGEDKHAKEQLYFNKRLKVLAYIKKRGELDLDQKKEKQIESLSSQDELLAVNKKKRMKRYDSEDEPLSKHNKMQINRIQNVASSSKRPRRYFYDDDYDEDDWEDEEVYYAKKKPRTKGSSSKWPHEAVKDDSNVLLAENKKKKMECYAREDESLLKQNKMQINRIPKVTSSSKRPRKYFYDDDYDEDDWEDEEVYYAKKKQRTKASSSKCRHKAFKDDSNEDNKKSNLKKKIEPIISNHITERLKEHITQQLNGTNIMLVIQKPLFASDLAGNQNRLTMPCSQVQTFDFLTEEERAKLDNSETDLSKYEIDVSLLGPTLQMFKQPLKLVKWKINSTQSYILRTNWSTFVKENKNELQQGATVQVWSYREENKNKLCFAIAVVKRADD